MGKCPYCGEEGVSPIGVLNVNVSFHITAEISHDGKLEFNIDSNPYDKADVLDEAIAHARQPVFHCPKCRHELTDDETLAMLKPYPEDE